MGEHRQPQRRHVRPQDAGPCGRVRFGCRSGRMPFAQVASRDRIVSDLHMGLFLMVDLTRRGSRFPQARAPEHRRNGRVLPEASAPRLRSPIRIRRRLLPVLPRFRVVAEGRVVASSYVLASCPLPLRGCASFFSRGDVLLNPTGTMASRGWKRDDSPCRQAYPFVYAMLVRGPSGTLMGVHQGVLDRGYAFDRLCSSR